MKFLLHRLNFSGFEWSTEELKENKKITNKYEKLASEIEKLRVQVEDKFRDLEMPDNCECGSAPIIRNMDVEKHMKWTGGTYDENEVLDKLVFSCAKCKDSWALPREHEWLSQYAKSVKYT